MNRADKSNENEDWLNFRNSQREYRRLVKCSKRNSFKIFRDELEGEKEISRLCIVKLSSKTTCNFHELRSLFNMESHGITLSRRIVNRSGMKGTDGFCELFNMQVCKGNSAAILSFVHFKAPGMNVINPAMVKGRYRVPRTTSKKSFSSIFCYVLRA